MGAFEATVGKVRSALKELVIRTRYRRQAVVLLQPFVDGRPIDASWFTTFDVYLLDGGRADFVYAANGLLPPDKRARLLVTLAAEMQQQTFHPRNSASDGDIIREIWAQSGDKEKLRDAVRSMKISPHKRSRVDKVFGDW
ncbi:hypothetical protein KJZ67_04150 [Patescibacteria group bacterium]|nr:hypothetical protein [Patescibacteria group bacterium]